LRASHHTDRFTLSVSNPTTGLQGIQLSDDVFKAFSSRGILNIEISEAQEAGGMITLINLAGKILLRKRVDYPGHYEFDLSLENGIYILSYVSGGRICTRKFFIANK